MNLADAKLVFLDVETTGLSPAIGDRIIEVGLISCAGDREVARVSHLVNPERDIPLAARRVHGIRDQDVAACAPFGAIAGEVASALDGQWVVGHNIRFDAGFIAMELACAGVPARPAGCLDTRYLAAAVWDLPNYRLDTVAEHVGAGGAGSHRALADAERTRAVFHRVIAELGGWIRVRIDELLALHTHVPCWPDDGRRNLPAAIYDALTNGSEVAVDYVNGLGTASRRSIRPLACFAAGKTVYLRAHCQLAGEVRTFRLDRIVVG